MSLRTADAVVTSGADDLAPSQPAISGPFIVRLMSGPRGRLHSLIEQDMKRPGELGLEELIKMKRLKGNFSLLDNISPLPITV